MKFKKSQSGRSMVEMLGVLAIIGVLSVGGIAGYSLSMRRHRANGVVDAASKYALVTYGQCQQKVMNGEANDLIDCSNGIRTTFEDAGIGALPAGVKEITVNKFMTSSVGAWDDVYINTVFTDIKLCQAVASIVGDSCYSQNSRGPTVYIHIKQN